MSSALDAEQYQFCFITYSIKRSILGRNRTEDLHVLKQIMLQLSRVSFAALALYFTQSYVGT